MMMHAYTGTSGFIQEQEALEGDQRSLMKVVEQSQSEDNVCWAYEFDRAFSQGNERGICRVAVSCLQSKYDFTHEYALDYLQM